MTAVALVCSCTDKQQECMECDKQADVQMAFEGAAEPLSRSGRVDFVGGYATAWQRFSCHACPDGLPPVFAAP
ncbi:MAG: hypothetical protein MR924_02290 [Prevotella sp.]|nr:hypothetical protein [Prevotella sp.]